MKYFTSDLHFGHEKSLNFQDRRGYSVEDWIKFQVEIINSTVHRNDLFYILGDFCERTAVNKYRQLIKCKNVWLILGNHDPTKNMCIKAFGRTKVSETYSIKIKKIPVWMSHYPHIAWPQSHNGSFHLYGHMHNQRTKFWEELFPEIRALDVCPESYKSHFGEFGIFSEDQIYDILSKRSGHDDVSWYKQNRGEL